MKIFLSLITALAFSASVFSQTPTPNPPVEDDGVVRISTNLIQVDATVLDKDGKIVTDLTADDFEIYENGKKQELTNFLFVGTPADKTVKSSAITKQNKNSVSLPNVSTTLRPEQVKRTIALIVDDLDLSFRSIDSVRYSLKKYVQEQMQDGDLVAIIRTGGGNGFLQQFTSDKRILNKAIEKIRWNASGSGKISAFTSVDPSDFGAPSNGPDKSLPLDVQEEIKAAQAQQKILEDSSRNQFNFFKEEGFPLAVLASINFIIKGMSELPGRKAAVLFSEGLALYEVDNGIKKPSPRLIDAFRRLTERANRSSVIIYTMDVRGVVNALMLGAEDNFDNINQDGGITKIEATALQRSTDLFETQQGLKALAEQTGGFAIVNNNNLSKGLERVLNDQKGYYLLGYQPDNETFDAKSNRFNKLTVKLKRPDLQVRYRSGFFGIKDEDIKPAPTTPRQQILNALTSPISSGDIDVNLTSLYANDNQTGDFMRSLLRVEGNGLKFSEEPDGWHKATFDIVAVIFGDNGKVIDEISRSETIKARDETLKEIREKGFVSTLTVPIKTPGSYQMRVVMRDASTSRIGSANQFIEVPDLKKNRLTLSGILLQRLSTVGTEKNINEKKQFQPDEERDFATRSFRGGMDVRFGFAVYNAKPDKTSNAPNLAMQYRIFQDGKQIFASQEKEARLVDKTDINHLFGEGIFTLGKTTKPGSYVLQIIVKDLAGGGKGQTATQAIDFEIADK